jgi:hypothetical protein
LLQQLPWLLLDALGMEEMAGIIIHYPFWQGAQGTTERFLHEHFGNVSHPGTEMLRPGRKLRIVCQQFAVGFELCAASCGIVDNGIHLVLLKDTDVAASQVSGLLPFSGMHMQRTAAHLLWWNADITAIRLQDSTASVMHLGVE